MENQIVLTTDQLQLITPDQAWHYQVIPESLENSILTLYCSESAPPNIQELEILLACAITLIKRDEEQISKALSTYYRRDHQKKEVEALNYNASNDDFLMKLISEAKNLGSSDIHIEIYDEQCRVRIRIDGKLVERYRIQPEEYPSLINRIKIMSNLDIAEKRLPQDGRIFFERMNHKFDIRVSVLPTLHGEKVVMRLLSNDATNIDINALGFGERDLKNYLEGIKKPSGILLISGPTGSGKTTTLYATLKLLNEESRNITTIEDPIEYTLDGINQVQLKENIGFTFGAALRTFLRQDPDVIMLGEIRDPDTASMAIRASLTGHLVLSTIHTNSAWGTISRLIDMDIPPYLVANTLSTSVAQRLVRKLCPKCKKVEKMDSSLYPDKFKPFFEVANHSVAQGCEACYYTGYRGRKAVYEVIPIDMELAENIKERNFEVSELLQERTIKTLAENAFELFAAQETSLEEIYPLLLNF